ncbi:MAG TPA: rhomboid family intramembrane serine protease [Polyangiaceae bacterium]|nr:rhomboid family intramembrane serine protease [Polyangiaceae bacterium]
MSEPSSHEDFATAEPTPDVSSGAPFTRFLIVANALVFLGELWFTCAHNGGWSVLLQAVFNIPSQAAMAFGANYSTATLYEGRIDTLVASCFVHWGILHIIFNMYALYQAGMFLEHEVGTGRMSVLYVGSGIVGSMVSAIYRGYFAEGQGTAAGASGAVCGLIGAILVVGYRTQGWRSPLMLLMAVWLGVTLILGKSGGFDNWAHGGGAVGGGLIAMLWRRGDEPRTLRTLSILAATATILASGMAVVYYDATRPFATFDVYDRLRFAAQAVVVDDCKEAWAASRAARRLAPHSPDVLHVVGSVRARCGQDPNAPPPLDGEGPSR